MKRLLLILTALFPLLLLTSCLDDNKDYDWDQIATRVPCFAGTATSQTVDLTNPLYVTVYQHVTDGRYFTGKSTSYPVISENYNWRRDANETQKAFYAYSFNDGTNTWYLNF